MKQEAYFILKSAFNVHKEALLRNRLSCLGILLDFGGRDHPEIYLIADAVDAHICQRIIGSQIVTDKTIDSISIEFAAIKCLSFEDARFAVESWADALSFYRLDPLKYVSNNERTSTLTSSNRIVSKSGKKPLIAIAWAAVLGPIGLLYISWKLSVVTLFLHIIVCAILGWPKLAVITFWHIVPFFIAYWVTRNVTSLSSLSRKLGTDSIASYGVIREISLSPVGASASTVLFLTGFILVGCIAFSNWLQLIFAFFLCVYASILTFDISRKYIEANKTATTASYPYRFLPNSEALKRWLFWAACTLLFVLTCKLWNQPPGLTTGLMRLFLICVTIGLPFAPVFRGAIGAVALGIIGGIASLIVAAIPAGIILYLFGIFTK